MRVLKVCIYDEEVNYARKLSAFLNRQGEGRFKVTAVTNMDSLMEYMGNGQFDILLASNPDTLCRIKKMKENCGYRREKNIGWFFYTVSGR